MKWCGICWSSIRSPVLAGSARWLLLFWMCCCCYCCYWCLTYNENTSNHDKHWHWGSVFRHSPTVRSVPFAKTTPLRITSEFLFRPLAKSDLTEQVLFWPPASLLQHGSQFLQDGKTPCDRRDSRVNFQRRPRLLGYNPIIVSLDRSLIFDSLLYSLFNDNVLFWRIVFSQYSSVKCLMTSYVFVVRHLICFIYLFNVFVVVRHAGAIDGVVLWGKGKKDLSEIVNEWWYELAKLK